MSKRTRWQPPHPAKNIGIPPAPKRSPEEAIASINPERLRPDSPEMVAIDTILERTFWCIWPGCEKRKFHELPVCEAHKHVITDYVDPHTREATRQREEAIAAVNKGEKIDKYAHTGGYVYFVRMDNLIKIGFTTKPYQRLRAYPPNAEVLGVFPGTKALEADLHGRFRFALSKGREWFRPADEITEYLDDMLAHYGPPDIAYTNRFQDPGPRQVVGGRRAHVGRAVV